MYPLPSPLPLLPSCPVPRRILRRTLHNLLGFTFSKITRVGARDVASDEKITAQQLRRYVHVVEVSAAMHLEATVKAIVAYKYESFFNTSHTGNFSLVPTDAAGRPEADSRMPTGAGELSMSLVLASC